MERESLGVADRDRAHSKWCGRGSRLLQVNLLRENLTTAELWCVHVVEGVLLQLYLYSNALACPEGGKCHLFFHVFTGWTAYMWGKQQLLGCEWFTAAGSRLDESQWFPSLMLMAGSRHNPTAIHVSWLADLRLTGSRRCIGITSAF